MSKDGADNYYNYDKVAGWGGWDVTAAKGY